MPNGLYTGRNRVVGGTGIGIVALVPLIAIPNSVVAGVLYGMITGMILRYLSCRLFSNSNAWISFFTVPSSAIFSRPFCPAYLYVHWAGGDRNIRQENDPSTLQSDRARGFFQEWKETTGSLMNDSAGFAFDAVLGFFQEGDEGGASSCLSA